MLAGGGREAEVMIEILEMELVSSRTSSSVRRQGYSGGECFLVTDKLGGNFGRDGLPFKEAVIAVRQ